MKYFKKKVEKVTHGECSNGGKTKEIPLHKEKNKHLAIILPVVLVMFAITICFLSILSPRVNISKFTSAVKTISSHRENEIRFSSNERAIYSDDSFIQGIAVSKEYIFAGYDTVKNSEIEPNQYHIRKLYRDTGKVVTTSVSTFNHTNDMVYNSIKNELVVTGLSDNDGTTDNDYFLFVVNADTLELKETVDLKEVVRGVCAESAGISAVSYSANYDEYYILTRTPERHIITLDKNFRMKHSIYLGLAEKFPGIMGGLYADGEHFYLANTIDLDEKTNEVLIFDKVGNLVSRKSINGIRHIEGIDYIDNKFYISFVDWTMQKSANVFSAVEIKDLQ